MVKQKVRVIGGIRVEEWNKLEEFLRAVKLASVFAREAANIVKINLGKERFKLTRIGKEI